MVTTTVHIGETADKTLLVVVDVAVDLLVPEVVGDVVEAGVVTKGALVVVMMEPAVAVVSGTGTQLRLKSLHLQVLHQKR